MRCYTVGTLVSVYLYPDCCQELYFKREVNTKASPLILIQAIELSHLSLITNNNQKRS